MRIVTKVEKNKTMVYGENLITNDNGQSAAKPVKDGSTTIM